MSIETLDAKFKQLKRNAEAGDAIAQFALGGCYSLGSDVAVNKSEGVTWYKCAAENRSMSAQARLGICYSKGEGISVDKVEPFKWYKRAAEAGHKVTIKKA